jgi:hypothetical protein
MRPVIGSNYRPLRYERRTPHEYSALRPPVFSDALRLQQSLTARNRRVDPEGLVSVIAWCVAIVLTLLLSLGVIQ